MRVLLPPSETKRSGGGSAAFQGELLAHADALGGTRARVLGALEALCAPTDEAGEDAAAAVLKLGVRARGEISHNRALSYSPTMPAIERYTGVLFDALDAVRLDADARAWVDAHVSIQSSLFGLIHAGDPIPAYRLSASTPLLVGQDPAGGTSTRTAKPARLKALWRDAHAVIPWVGVPFIIDLRSKDYAALAPVSADANVVVVEVAQRTADGRTRALNHFNKQAKGDLVRRLAESGAEIGSAAELIAWGSAHGLEFVPGDTPREITLVTSLGAPPAPPSSVDAVNARSGDTMVGVPKGLES